MLVVSMAACATPIGVNPVDIRTVNDQLTANVLSKERPSDTTLQELNRLGFGDRFEDDPDAVIAELHEGLGASRGEDRLFALAELSFLRAQATHDRSRLLAAAAYAYAFLFPEGQGRPPGPFDPRLRVATDLYNRAVTHGLATDDGKHVQLAARTIDLPFGSLTIEPASPVFTWAGYQLVDFVSAADLSVRGLRNRYRQRGIGAPLAATLSPDLRDDPPPGVGRIPPRLRVPVTALLRFEKPRSALISGKLRATLKTYSPDDARHVQIDGRDVPLEFETTSSLALTLEGSPIWAFERQGFRGLDVNPFGPDVIRDSVAMLHPYRPGRIPVVLVHGTASSPARWAELVNELENDPRIWDRYQIWLFIYNTGNPIALSGALLREALIALVRDLDPSGQDPALRRMVVMGHSQGGLLTKLTAVESGDRFWHLLSDEPFDQVELEPETRDLLRRSLFFEPLPFVQRVVFVCTPHRGSYLTVLRFAGLQPARWAAGLVRLPVTLVGVGADLLTLEEDRKLRRGFEKIPTSIDNMTPGNPFLQQLADTPIADGVRAHSIIAVDGDGPPEEGGDGVVKYASAHIEGVESELVVRSSHSAQAQPATIREVKRILLEHLADTPAPSL